MSYHKLKGLGEFMTISGSASTALTKIPEIPDVDSIVLTCDKAQIERNDRLSTSQTLNFTAEITGYTQQHHYSWKMDSTEFATTKISSKTIAYLNATEHKFTFHIYDINNVELGSAQIQIPVINKTGGPIFIGVEDTEPQSTRSGELLIEGDYFVYSDQATTNKGNAFVWDGYEFVELTDSNKLLDCYNALVSTVDLNTISNCNTIVWMKTLVANKIVADSIFSNEIVMSADGTIQSATYTESGDSFRGGYKLDSATGEIKAEGAILHKAKIQGQLTSFVDDTGDMVFSTVSPSSSSITITAILEADPTSWHYYSTKQLLDIFAASYGLTSLRKVSSEDESLRLTISNSNAEDIDYFEILSGSGVPTITNFTPHPLINARKLTIYQNNNVSVYHNVYDIPYEWTVWLIKPDGTNLRFAEASGTPHWPLNFSDWGGFDSLVLQQSYTNIARDTFVSAKDGIRNSKTITSVKKTSSTQLVIGYSDNTSETFTQGGYYSKLSGTIEISVSSSAGIQTSSMYRINSTDNIGTFGEPYNEIHGQQVYGAVFN